MAFSFILLWCCRWRFSLYPVATLAALHAAQTLGPWAYLFPLLIALSCIFTKQHYLIDLPFGAALGWLAFKAYVALP